MNAALFKLEESHPARAFLEALIACRQKCVGCELHGIDQVWWSSIDNRERQFSAYLYERISCDYTLDGWLTNDSGRTQHEAATLKALPEEVLRMKECQQAARAAANDPVVEYTRAILEMYELWRIAIESRIRSETPQL